MIISITQSLSTSEDATYSFGCYIARTGGSSVQSKSSFFLKLGSSVIEYDGSVLTADYDTFTGSFTATDTATLFSIYAYDNVVSLCAVWMLCGKLTLSFVAGHHSL